MNIKLFEALKQFFDKLDEVHAQEVSEAGQGVATLERLLDQMLPSQTLCSLEKRFQKIEIRYDEASYTYSARLWYNGNGMLPPNIEIYRVRTEDALIKAIYLAAYAAFSEETDDDSE